MKTKSLLGVVLGVGVLTAGFFYISKDLISTNETTLSLLSNVAYPKPGEEFNVQVLLTTKQQVDGVDVFLTYNPSLVEVVDFPVGDSVFDEYIVGPQTPDGLVAFSVGTKPLGEKVSGLGTVGAVTFRALDEGQASFQIEHEAGNTRDSNVAVAGDDILEGVKGVNITISSTTPRGK